MGYFDDSDSESEMGDQSMMSCSGVSFTFGSRRKGRGGGGMDDSSHRRKATANKPAFKFSWDDSSGHLSCEDLQASESSFGTLQKQKLGRQKNPKMASPLEKLLEQVDGVAYNEDDDDDDDKQEDVPGLSALSDESEEDSKEDSKEPPRQITIQFCEPLVTHQLDFVQDEDAPTNVWKDDHVAQDHDQVSWEDQEYEELPWHLVPDLDADDELTKRCKEVIQFTPKIVEEEEDNDNDEESDSDEEDEDEEGEGEKYNEEYRRRVDRVEALVIRFVLTLQYKRLQRLQ